MVGLDGPESWARLLASEADEWGQHLRAEAHAAVLTAAPMLTAAEVARALGSDAKNPRALVRTLRRRSVLVGVPRPSSRAYAYPAFQIDPSARRVHPVVQAVNEAMHAGWDPWGVASWWTSPHGALTPGLAPMHLVGTRRATDLFVMAGVVSGSAAARAGRDDQ